MKGVLDEFFTFDEKFTNPRFILYPVELEDLKKVISKKFESRIKYLQEGRADWIPFVVTELACMQDELIGSESEESMSQKRSKA